MQFLRIEAVQNGRGRIIVCGEVNGRNSAGNVTISPFVGVLMGSDGDNDFVVVGIGSPDRERVEETRCVVRAGFTEFSRSAREQAAVSSTSVCSIAPRRAA